MALLGHWDRPLPRPRDDAERLVERIWEHRRLAQVLFKDETHTIVVPSFAAEFEVSIQGHLCSFRCTPLLAPNLIALQLAASQLAVLSAWVSGCSGHSAHEIAVELHASGHAAFLALMTSPDVAVVNC